MSTYVFVESYRLRAGLGSSFIIHHSSFMIHDSSFQSFHLSTRKHSLLTWF
jgi:hypothetical protein